MEAGVKGPGRTGRGGGGHAYQLHHLLPRLGERAVRVVVIRAVEGGHGDNGAAPTAAGVHRVGGCAEGGGHLEAAASAGAAGALGLQAAPRACAEAAAHRKHHVAVAHDLEAEAGGGRRLPAVSAWAHLPAGIRGGAGGPHFAPCAAAEARGVAVVLAEGGCGGRAPVPSEPVASLALRAPRHFAEHVHGLALPSRGAGRRGGQRGAGGALLVGHAFAARRTLSNRRAVSTRYWSQKARWPSMTSFHRASSP